MTEKVTIGFIGLGVMGYPMAGQLAAAGHTVRAHNRTEARTQRWLADYGGIRAATPREAAEGADFVFTIVGNDDDVRSVARGDDGLLAGLRPGAVFVDHTTTSAELARELAVAVRELRCEFLDAPVSGGQAGAEDGRLTIMVGGAEQAFARAKPVMAVYARMMKRMGDVGFGQLTKMVNQICIAGVLQGLAEGLRFAELCDLEIGEVVDVISKGAAQSWQMEHRHVPMAAGEFDFGFAVDWMRKDLGIALRAAEQVGAPLNMTRLIDSFYAEIQDMGGGRWDTCSLIQRLRR